MKRLISLIMFTIILFHCVPAIAVKAAEEGLVTVENEYIRVTVSCKNGGYTIATVDGDILRKTDDNQKLTHRGVDYDTSFTSFQINGDPGQEYIFGNSYGFLGSDSTAVITESDTVGVTSKWSVKDLEITQRIELVSGVNSEQLGTALISYTVKNNAAVPVSLKSRVLMDTQLGENDFGYYEVTKGVLGAGYSFIDRETVISGANVPADYFVKDSPFEPSIAAFGVNSVIATDRPYQMAFAHWVNLASQKFDFTPDESVSFANKMNKHQTADSAVALYYDLQSVAPDAERVFSTFYGVTANLKNKENQVLINTTAPSKLEFNEARDAFIGSSGNADNLIRINSTISNPVLQNKAYKRLAVAVYAIGFTTQRQADSGAWIVYDNADPLYTEIINFTPGKNLTTFFDFKFEPRDTHELGCFVTKVFDVDPAVNELGVYAEDYCLGQTTNYIFIPAKDPNLPTITLNSLEPKMVYNDERRYLTVTGTGMSFFQTGLQAIELRGERKTYQVPVDNLTISQDSKSIALMLTGYMETGSYQLHFLWDGSQPDDIPANFTSPGMVFNMTSDESYRQDKYGILAVYGDGGGEYAISAYNDENAFARAEGSDYDADKLFFVLRGDVIKDNVKDEYRVAGRDKDININHILNYRGSDFKVSAEGGAVEILMDGKLTTVGANTTVRNGSARFTLNAGTKYIVPVYDNRGEILSGDSLGAREDYIELRWNNAVDTLQTIGGFLIDLKYGVLGKMEDGGNLYDIISFGGGLDLSFMTPGGAKTARENESKRDSWEISTLDDKSGLMPISRPVEVESAPDTKDVYQLEAGARVHDVLYGQNRNKTGYLGINMEAHLQLPQIVSFLPSKMSGNLAINTIGGYQVGIEGEGKAANFEMAFALVIKSNPSGAPIPDKLYFTLGGFEPGVNVDGLGIFWVTGGGGGFDNLYETIYGTDGIPPFKLLLNVQFDIFKIMTGSADLGLSLRSFSIALGDVSLKMIKNAKFLDSGNVSVTWYPNYDLNVGASINFLSVFKGRFSLVSNQELFEMMLRVALCLPEYIPIVGGIELAAVELGGGTEKMWGSAEVLGLVKIGFTYYWASGDLVFGSNGRSASRTEQVFMAMTAPQAIGTDPETGETQYMAVGSNLDYIAGSVIDQSLTAQDIKAMKSATALRARAGGAPTNVISTPKQDSHVATLGTPEGDYILTVSRANGGPLGDNFANVINVWNNGEAYPLNFYQKTGIVAGMGGTLTLSDAEKKAIEDASKNANVNVIGNIAYIAIPKAHQANPLFLIEFTDGAAYDVGAVYAAPICALTRQSAAIESGKLKLNWAGTDLGDTANITVTISDVAGEDGIILAKDIPAKNLTAEIEIPDNAASGVYNVTLKLIDEDKCYETYNAGQVTITDVKAPTAVTGVTLANAGNHKLALTINDDFTKPNLEGYYVDVYEDGNMIEAALYYSKEQAQSGGILIGGRYDVPEMEEYTDSQGDTQYRQKTGANGIGIFRTLGFTPGRSYRVKVRAGGSETVNSADVYHYSAYVTSTPVVLKAAAPPVLSITADGAVPVGRDGIGFVLASETNVFKLTANKPVKGSFSVNGASGETYELDTEYKSEWRQELTLSDGVHSLEVAAVDEEGNQSMYQTSVSIDTTPPSLMLESPVNGGMFNNQILIRGIADTDALYTFKIDGVTVGGVDRDMSAYFADGILNYTINLAGDTANRHTVEIIAKDAAGNVTSKRAEVVNSSLPDIRRVEIHLNGQRVPTGGIRLNSSYATASLKLMGITGEGRLIDITGSENVSFDIVSGSGARVNENIVMEAGEGSAMVMASLNLGGGYALTDAVMVLSGGDILYDALDNAIADASALDEGDFTAGSWADLQEALTSGIMLRTMSGLSQEIINNAATAIANAISNLVMKSDDANADISAARALIEAATYVKPQAEVPAQAQAKAVVETIIAGLALNGVTAAVLGGTFTAAAAGTAANPNGTNGSYTFTVKLNKAGGTEQVTDELTLTIIAAQYDANADNAAISTAKGLIENASYVDTQSNVPNISSAREKVRSVINGLSLDGVTAEIIDGVFTAAVAGTANSRNGTDGSYTFTVKLGRGAGTEQITRTLTLVIKATAYSGSNGGGGGGGSIVLNHDTPLGNIELPRYTITFNTNGGSKIPSVRVAKDDKLTKPANPTKTGYLFLGWYTDKELKNPYDFEQAVTRSFTLYAGWKTVAKWQNPFDDVSEDDWFYDYVEYVYTQRLMVGTNTAPMLFSPNMILTRGMVVTVLHNYEGNPDVKGLANPFEDVSADKWYANAVKWAANNGIVSGYGGGRFGPEDIITRQDVAVILNNYAVKSSWRIPGIRDYSIFDDDADIANYAKDAVERFFKAGIISGRPGNIFDPKGRATRAEFAAMLAGFLKVTEKE